MSETTSQKVSMEKLHPLICESIRDGGQFVFYPSGTSMLPTIVQGDDCVVLTEPVSIRKYDLVLFTRTSGTYVLHRIMKIKNGKYIISGDNQTWTETINKEQIIATVSEIRKKSGSVLTYAEFSNGRKMLCLRMTKLARRVIGKIRRIIKGK